MRLAAGLALPAVLAACGIAELTEAPGILAPNAPAEFVVFGDTQKTMTLEFWRPHHDAERQALVRAVADERPAFVVNAGDLVCHGGREADWERFCRENRPLFDRGIAYFPAIGNHDLYGGTRTALDLRARVFPHIGTRRWYEIRFPPVLIAVLDSNFDDLGEDRVRAQDEWLESLLAGAERDGAIRHVLLVCHHPPFTNARGLSESRGVQEHFVGRMTPKVHVFLSGHVHNYERFEKGGVAFVVSGGGGGPPRELEAGHPAHEDLYPGDRSCPFHYCRFKIDGAALRCDVVMLQPDGTWTRVDGFERGVP